MSSLGHTCYTISMLRHHVSFKHALDGLIYCFKTQPNFRFHLLATLVVTIFGYYLHLSVTEWLILTFTIFLVLGSEMINTALESMTDLITSDYKLEAKIAKDVSAGMVLLSAIVSLIVAALIFLPHLGIL